MNKVLLAVDGSKNSTIAASYAADHFVNCELTLLHIVEPIKLKNVAIERNEIRELYEFEIQENLKDALSVFREKGISVKTVVQKGKPAEEICKASTQGFHCVVMGSRGLNELSGMFLGSVTTGVIAHSRVPVLIIRENFPIRKDGLKIAVAVDAGPLSAKIFKFIRTNLDKFGFNSEFQLVHVLQSPLKPNITSINRLSSDTNKFSQPDNVDFQSKFSPFFADIKSIPNTVYVKLEGEPAKELADYVDKEKPDLVVMGTHARSGISAVLIGSTVTRLLMSSKSPILVIP